MNNQSESKKNHVVTDKEDRTIINGARRKLTKAGIITPVIMSLSSRPAWAINCTASGNLSGNASDPNYEAACGAPGMSPKYWENNQNQWCAVYLPGDSFNSTAGITVFQNNPTLSQIIGGDVMTYPIDLTLLSNCSSSNAGDIYYLSQLFIAALQNAIILALASPPYPKTDVQVKTDFTTALTTPCSGVSSATTAFEILNNPDPI